MTPFIRYFNVSKNADKNLRRINEIILFIIKIALKIERTFRFLLQPCTL